MCTWQRIYWACYSYACPYAYYGNVRPDGACSDYPNCSRRQISKKVLRDACYHCNTRG